MTHPLFAHITTLSAAERRDRAAELQWLHDLAEPRRPERNRGRSDVGDAPARPANNPIPPTRPR